MNEITSMGSVEFLPSSLKYLNLAHNQLSKCFQPILDSNMLACQALGLTNLTATNFIINDTVNRHSSIYFNLFFS